MKTKIKIVGVEQNASGYFARVEIQTSEYETSELLFGVEGQTMHDALKATYKRLDAIGKALTAFAVNN